jgi:hypothetical protein
MSAKLTVILFILICLEIGSLLVFLPWHRSWEQNRFLMMATTTFDQPWIAAVVLSGYFRGFVTGLGVVNILVGIWEILNFRATVDAFRGGDAPVSHH